MKKLNNIVILILITLFFFGCEDLNEPIIWEGINVGFKETSSTCYVDYQVGGTTEFEIETMLIANVQSNNISVNVEVVDTLGDAVEGTHFSLTTNEATITAGETFGNYTITVYNDNFTGPDDIREVTLKLTSNEIDIQSEYELIEITLEPFCPYDINNLVGTYEVNETSAYDGALSPYLINVTTGTGDTLLVTGLSGLPEIKVALDPESFEVTIPSQIIGYTSTYSEDIRVINTSVGTLSTCFNTISVPYKIYISLGNFDDLIESTWVKQ